MEVLLGIIMLLSGLLLGHFTALWFQIIALLVGVVYYYRIRNKYGPIRSFAYGWYFAIFTTGLIAGDVVFYTMGSWQLIIDWLNSIGKFIMSIINAMLHFILR